MPYFKLDLRITQTYNRKKFAVVHAQKANYPYYSGCDVAGGNEGSNIWDLVKTYRYSMNEWLYIRFYRHKENELLVSHGLHNSTYKFNNTVYEIPFDLVTDIAPCTRKFYHEHKDLICKASTNPYASVRDSQKSKVYRSENTIKTTGKMNDSETMKFINKVVCSNAYKDFSDKFYDFFKDESRINNFDVELNPRGKTWARGGQNGLTLPDWAKSEFVILHEMAHLIMRRMFNGTIRRKRKMQGHGQEFCFILLYLVQEFMDDYYLYELLQGYENNNVKYLLECEGLSL